MEPYTYKALPLQSPAIRLISLLPSGDENAPLVCSISQSELPPTKPYTALSYCWGDPTSRHTLTVLDPSSPNDRRSLEIGQSLNTALLQLRSRTESRTLWVDAICINQDDTDERGKQVPLMAQIYRGATEVLAWLGEAGEDGDAAFTAIKQLSRVWAGASQGTNDTPLSRTKAFEHSRNFMSLLRRPYFRRVWIIQEIGMGGSRATVQCGSNTATWEQLVHACVITIVSRAATLAFSGVEFAIMIDTARGDECCNIFERDQGSSTELLSVLCRYRNFDATDARDKVFALLNLSSQEEVLRDQRLVPNYHKDTASVYRDAAVAIMERTRSLNILRVPKVLQSQGTPSLQLPSWVPDWTAKTQSMTLDLYSMNTKTVPEPALATEDPVQFRISRDGNELHLKAVDCSVRIKALGPPLASRQGVQDTEPSILEFNRKSFSEANVILQWEELAGAHPAAHSSPYPIGIHRHHSREDKQTISEAFSRTLLLGRDYENEHRQGLRTGDFETWSKDHMGWARRLRRFGLLESDTFLPVTLTFQFTWGIATRLLRALNPLSPQAGVEYEGSARFSDELAAAAIGRRFFLTEDGLYGMGPMGLEKGDRIVLVKGVHVPLAVRNASSEGAVGQKWTLVGDCYIHSKEIIDGVVWSRKTEQDLTLV